MHLLSTLADSAAIAIENARLYWQADSERAKLDTILREIEDAVIVTDADFRLLLVNNAARAAFNLTDAALGQLLADVIPMQGRDRSIRSTQTAQPGLAGRHRAAGWPHAARPIIGA